MKIKNSGNQPEFNHQSKNEQLLNCRYVIYCYIGVLRNYTAKIQIIFKI